MIQKVMGVVLFLLAIVVIVGTITILSLHGPSMHRYDRYAPLLFTLSAVYIGFSLGYWGIHVIFMPRKL